IARALLGSVFSLRRCFIDPLFNVARLLRHFPDHAAGVGVENAIAIDVADVANGGAYPLLKIKLRIAGYLPGKHDEVSLGKGLAGDATQRIRFETGVENVIADGVADFIGMTFGDGLGRKDVTAGHELKNVEGLKR